MTSSSSFFSSPLHKSKIELSGKKIFKLKNKQLTTKRITIEYGLWFLLFAIVVAYRISINVCCLFLWLLRCLLFLHSAPSHQTHGFQCLLPFLSIVFIILSFISAGSSTFSTLTTTPIHIEWFPFTNIYFSIATFRFDGSSRIFDRYHIQWWFQTCI